MRITEKSRSLQSVSKHISLRSVLILMSVLVLGGASGCTPTPEPTGPDNIRVALNQNFPDPSIIGTTEIDPITSRPQRVWYAFATEGAGRHIQRARSTDLLNWELLSDALPLLPSWADPRLIWAPSVIAAGSEFRLYYSIINATNGEHCISVARSTTAAGPYVDTSIGPVVCTPPGEGSIDPSPFLDSDGTPWLVWSTEGNISGKRVILSGQLDPTGKYILAGTEGTIFTGTSNWERNIVEAPHFIRANGTLWLFYAGNDWNSSKYGIGVAECDTPRGPCTRTFDLPLLTSRNPLKGPGGAHLVVEPSGETFLAFHGWNGTVGYANGGRRVMALLTLYFEDGEPKLSGAPSAVVVPS